MRWVLAVVLASVLSLSVSACFTEVPARPSSGSTIVAHSGSQDEAESVWRAYLSASNKTLSNQAVEPTILRPYLTASHYKVVVQQVDTFRTSGRRLKGGLTSSNFALQSSAEKRDRITAFVCVNNTESSVINAEGLVDKTPRPDDFTLKLTFTTKNGRFLIDGDKTWTQSSAC